MIDSRDLPVSCVYLPFEKLPDCHSSQRDYISLQTRDWSSQSILIIRSLKKGLLGPRDRSKFAEFSRSPCSHSRPPVSVWYLSISSRWDFGKTLMCGGSSQSFSHTGGRAWRVRKGWYCERTHFCLITCSLRGCKTSSHSVLYSYVPLPGWVLHKDLLAGVTWEQSRFLPPSHPGVLSTFTRDWEHTIHCLAHFP